MLTPARQLAELVRILQERQFIFAVDPQPITDSLRAVAGSVEEKLIRRAKLIDANQELNAALGRVRKLLALLLWGATFFWLMSGFLGVFTLMQQSGLNFFWVLVGVLGWHTLMLMIWLVCLPLGKQRQTLWADPSFWLRGNDAVRQSVAKLYAEMWQQPDTKWRLGMNTHRLWLATFIGMLVAALLLLSVRQYTFGWESTILSDAVFIRAVEILGWLPASLGFSVPDGAAVALARSEQQIGDARQWSSFLIGCIICYGVLPRLLAWLFCYFQTKRYIDELPLEKPYYRHIIQQWQTKIIDADTQQEQIQTASMPITLAEEAAKWAVMAESAWPDAEWYRYVLGQDWLDKGVAESRQQMAALQTELAAEPVQLLIGVRAQAVPDRGLLRRIVALADAATAGVVVQLLLPTQAETATNNHLNLWHTALAQHQLAWLDPPQISQKNQIHDMQSAAQSAMSFQSQQQNIVAPSPHLSSADGENK